MDECKRCGKPFKRIHGQQAYCSKECRLIVNRERASANRKTKGSVEKKCECCGKTFVQTGHARKYCTDECAREMKRSQMKVVHSKKEKPKKKNTLREINKKAKEHGMSYGMYVAYMQKGAT